ncbi:tubulin glycylase 3B isoform X2 [Aethina tumida]|uniref:tubulin glycylase 3B isoform X2 n=1 Tax=Aethina tumida TaxID=116153 RepID=UPI00096B50F5|nr:tubulin glycylase 3B isoform X2 [Aethina tumida]
MNKKQEYAGKRSVGKKSIDDIENTHGSKSSDDEVCTKCLKKIASDDSVEDGDQEQEHVDSKKCVSVFSSLNESTDGKRDKTAKIGDTKDKTFRSVRLTVKNDEHNNDEKAPETPDENRAKLTEIPEENEPKLTDIAEENEDKQQPRQKELSKMESESEMKKLEYDLVKYSYEDHLAKVSKEMQAVLNDLREHLINLNQRRSGVEEESYTNVLSQIKETYRTSIKNSKIRLATPVRTQKKDEKQVKKKSPPKIVPESKTRTQGKRIPSLAELKARVDFAVHHHKVFMIRGRWDAIRNALVRRGWIEKLYFPSCTGDVRRFMSYTVTDLASYMRIEDKRPIVQRVICSRYLGDQPVDLYWSAHHQSFTSQKQPLVNRFRNDVFSYTNKGGLCDGSQQEYWYRIPDVAGMNHPRTYRVNDDEDRKNFIKDYRTTAAISLIKWVVKTHESGEQKILSPSGKISINMFDFAVAECYKFIKRKKHHDIDYPIVEATEGQWKVFLEAFSKIVYIGNHFRQVTHDQSESDMVKKSKFLLKIIGEIFPYLQMDGHMNLWILKPINSCMGIGISVCRDINRIMNIVHANTKRRYVAQKYIERPFLIHNTKFDIRQWFLISCSNPLTIWMYKSCYLRFCSQTYNLNWLHESVHLTNNAVQKRYMHNMRDLTLPSYLMWTSQQFQDYLSNIGYPKAFKNSIYPAMKQCFTAAVLMLQNKMDKKNLNSFELYGADYVVTEDFNAWLIEINSNPALFSSTPITRVMCPQVLEDVIKVVVDHRRNPKSPTGNFELIYKQKEKEYSKTALKLRVCGKPAPQMSLINMVETLPSVDSVISDVTKTSGTEKRSMSATEKRESPTKEIVRTKSALVDFGKGMRETLDNLQKLIKREKEKQNNKKSTGTETAKTNVGAKGHDTYCNAVADQNEKDDVSISTTSLQKLEMMTKGNQLTDEELSKTLKEFLLMVQKEKAKKAKTSKSSDKDLLDVFKAVLSNLKNEGRKDFLQKIKQIGAT